MYSCSSTSITFLFRDLLAARRGLGAKGYQNLHNPHSLIILRHTAILKRISSNGGDAWIKCVEIISTSGNEVKRDSPDFWTHLGAG